MVFEPQKARYVKIVNSLSKDCQKIGWSNDLKWQPFGGEDGRQVTEIHVGMVKGVTAGHEGG